MLTYRGRHRLDSTRLGHRFNLLWAGQAVSQIGDKVAYLSIPLFVVFLSDRSFDLAITYTLDTLPMLLVGFFGGVLLDRLKLRPLMVVADLLRAGAFFFLARIAADGGVETAGGRLAAVFVMTFLTGTLAVTFGNALYTLLPSLVSRQDLATANGRIAASEYAALALGPILAGILVEAFGFWPTFVLNGLTFVVSAATLAALGPVDAERERSARGVLGDALHGLHYVWSEIRLRLVTGAAALGNFVVGFLESTFVILAGEVGATSNLQKGILFATFGIGAAVGSVAAPTTTRMIGLGKTMTIGLAVFGAGMALFVDARYGLASILFLFVANFGLAHLNVALVTIRQAYTPPVMLGRVITASRAVGWATLPLGSLIGAAIADQTQRYSTVAAFAPLLAVLTAALLIATPVWSDTFGPGPGRRVEPRSARKTIRI